MTTDETEQLIKILTKIEERLAEQVVEYKKMALK